MPFGGRRSKLGSMHGPMNHAYLNGTHPAMLVAMRFNSDVQLPYRLPVSSETHADDCCDNPKCVGDVDEDEIIDSCQNAQNAQAGYACDYTAKNQAMAFNEVKECCKGHENVSAKLRGESLNYVAGRHRKRLLNVALGKM